MNINTNHMHNRAENIYVSGTCIQRPHSKEFLCKSYKMECSTGCEWRHCEELSFLEMLAVPFIFVVEWADGCREYLTHDATSELRGTPRREVLDLRPSSPLRVCKILVAKLQSAWIPSLALA